MLINTMVLPCPEDTALLMSPLMSGLYNLSLSLCGDVLKMSHVWLNTPLTLILWTSLMMSEKFNNLRSVAKTLLDHYSYSDAKLEGKSQGVLF